jgi:EAL domain-containing protein (putative c-di-GMP-specific phosphodiesterase class I)
VCGGRAAEETHAAVFIGGSTDWKLGRHAEAVIRAAQAMGVWVHVGRVNTAQRIEKFLEMGVDSIDGASLSRHGAGYTRDRGKIRAVLESPKLFTPTEERISR